MGHDIRADALLTTAVTAKHCLFHSCTQATGNAECSQSQWLLLPTIACATVKIRQQVTQDVTQIK